MTMLQWAHMGVRIPAGMCSAIWTRVSSSLGWGWGKGRAGTGPLGVLALPLPFIPKDGVIKPVGGRWTAGDGGETQGFKCKRQKETKKWALVETQRVRACVCLCFPPRCVSYLTSALSVYTPSRCRGGACSWLTAAVTTVDSPHQSPQNLFRSTFDTFLWHMCMHTHEQHTHTRTTEPFLQLKPRHLAKHVAWPLICKQWMDICFCMWEHSEARGYF